MIWFGIGIACAVGVQVIRLTRKARKLEDMCRGNGHAESLNYERLNIHSRHMGLMSQKDIDDVEAELPMGSCDWSKAAIEVEKKKAGRPARTGWRK